VALEVRAGAKSRCHRTFAGVSRPRRPLRGQRPGLGRCLRRPAPPSAFAAADGSLGGGIPRLLGLLSAPGPVQDRPVRRPRHANISPGPAGR